MKYGCAMCSENAFTLTPFRRERGLKTQQGVSLILVLFLLVVVSLLAAAMAQLNRGGSTSVGLEIQSTRALFAAESGAQIAAMRIFPINGSSAGGNCGNFNQPFNNAGLNNCSAAVTCSGPVTVNNIYVYKVESIGTCGAAGSNDYARRKITMALRGSL